MPDKTWKAVERRVAAYFGTLRNRLSGGSNRKDTTRSDSKHEFLFIETKHRQKHTTWTLWRETKELAKKEDKTPVVCLAEKGKKGFLVVCHSSDLPVVAACRERAKREGVE